jgi:outer membrane protein assembly factor BamD (BamD/ComL family)
MNRIFFTAVFISSCFSVKAQQKPLAVKDSNAIKEFYFEGLKEKLSENFVNASNSFKT